MLSHRQGAAWRQACFSFAVVAAVVAATVYCAVRPFDRDTLAIQVGQLGSQAAEAAMAARLLREDKLAPGFVHAHARQLRRKLGSVESQLRAHPSGGLDAAHGEAEAGAQALAGALQRESPSRDPRSESDYSALSARMQALRKRLKPEG